MNGINERKSTTNPPFRGPTHHAPTTRRERILYMRKKADSTNVSILAAHTTRPPAAPGAALGRGGTLEDRDEVEVVVLLPPPPPMPPGVRVAEVVVSVSVTEVVRVDDLVALGE
jgi:hypothetical protein